MGCAFALLDDGNELESNYVNEQPNKDKEDQVTESNQNKVDYAIVDNYNYVGTNSLGIVWMEGFVVVENTGTTNLYLESGSFDIEDENGKIVGSQSYVNVYPSVIAPGERAVYYDSFSLDYIDVNKTYKIVPKIDVERARVPLLRMNVTETSIKEDAFGGIDIVGRVENTTNEEQTLYKVIAFLYDKNDKIIGIIYTYPDKLAAGDKIGFEISHFSYKDIAFEDIARFEVIAQPFQTQF